MGEWSDLIELGLGNNRMQDRWRGAVIISYSGFQRRGWKRMGRTTGSDRHVRVGLHDFSVCLRLSSVSSLCNRDGCRVGSRLAIASTLSRKYLLHHNVPEIPPDRKSVHHIPSASRRTVSTDNECSPLESTVQGRRLRSCPLDQSSRSHPQEATVEIDCLNLPFPPVSGLDRALRRRLLVRSDETWQSKLFSHTGQDISAPEVRFANVYLKSVRENRLFELVRSIQRLQGPVDL